MVLPALGLLALAASAHAGTLQATFTGKVKTYSPYHLDDYSTPSSSNPSPIGNASAYSGEPVVGRPVTAMIQCASSIWFPMFGTPITTTTVMTGATGQYSASVSISCTSNKAFAWVMTRGSEVVESTTLRVASLTTFAGTYQHITGTQTIALDLLQAPHLVDDAGRWWTRRWGPKTLYNITYTEGFDALDHLKSAFYLNALAFSPVDSNVSNLGELKTKSNLLTYLPTQNYAVWLLMSGPHGGDSLMGKQAFNGSTTSNNTDGMVYEAMTLTHKIASEVRATMLPSGPRWAGQCGPTFPGLVVGGYSMGPTVVHAGLRKWCRGDWMNDGLPTSCNDVAAWWSGDAAFEGATIPMSLQQLLQYDDSATANNTTYHTYNQHPYSYLSLPGADHSVGGYWNPAAVKITMIDNFRQLMNTFPEATDFARKVDEAARELDADAAWELSPRRLSKSFRPNRCLVTFGNLLTRVEYIKAHSMLTNADKRSMLDGEWRDSCYLGCGDNWSGVTPGYSFDIWHRLKGGAEIPGIQTPINSSEWKNNLNLRGTTQNDVTTAIFDRGQKFLFGNGLNEHPSRNGTPLPSVAFASGAQPGPRTDNPDSIYFRAELSAKALVSSPVPAIVSGMNLDYWGVVQLCSAADERAKNATWHPQLVDLDTTHWATNTSSWSQEEIDPLVFPGNASAWAQFRMKISSQPWKTSYQTSESALALNRSPVWTDYSWNSSNPAHAFDNTAHGLSKPSGRCTTNVNATNTCPPSFECYCSDHDDAMGNCRKTSGYVGSQYVFATGMYCRQQTSKLPLNMPGFSLDTAHFLLGFFHRQLKGGRLPYPICTNLRTGATVRSVGKNAARHCTPAVTEIPGNGIDDDGDEQVDNACCGASGTFDGMNCYNFAIPPGRTAYVRTVPMLGAHFYYQGTCVAGFGGNTTNRALQFPNECYVGPVPAGYTPMLSTPVGPGNTPPASGRWNGNADACGWHVVSHGPGPAAVAWTCGVYTLPQQCPCSAILTASTAQVPQMMLASSSGQPGTWHQNELGIRAEIRSEAMPLVSEEDREALEGSTAMEQDLLARSDTLFPGTELSDTAAQAFWSYDAASSEAQRALDEGNYPAAVGALAQQSAEALPAPQALDLAFTRAQAQAAAGEPVSGDELRGVIERWPELLPLRETMTPAMQKAWLLAGGRLASTEVATTGELVPGSASAEEAPEVLDLSTSYGGQLDTSLGTATYEVVSDERGVPLSAQVVVLMPEGGDPAALCTSDAELPAPLYTLGPGGLTLGNANLEAALNGDGEALEALHAFLGSEARWVLAKISDLTAMNGGPPALARLSPLLDQLSDLDGFRASVSDDLGAPVSCTIGQAGQLCCRFFGAFRVTSCDGYSP